MEKSYTDWYQNIDGAIEAATGLRLVRARFCPALDDHWFIGLFTSLRELKEMRHPRTFKDGSGFWMYPSTPLPDRADAIVKELTRASFSLADVQPAPLGRYTPADTLRSIGQEAVRLHDLPADLGATHLRALDAKGWVHAQAWVRQSVRGTSGEQWVEQPIAPGWFSPAAEPSIAGEWKAIFEDIAPPPKHVRLTIGRCERVLAKGKIARLADVHGVLAALPGSGPRPDERALRATGT